MKYIQALSSRLSRPYPPTFDTTNPFGPVYFQCYGVVFEILNPHDSFSPACVESSEDSASLHLQHNNDTVDQRTISPPMAPESDSPEQAKRSLTPCRVLYPNYPLAHSKITSAGPAKSSRMSRTWTEYAIAILEHEKAQKPYEAGLPRPDSAVLTKPTGSSDLTKCSTINSRVDKIESSTPSPIERAGGDEMPCRSEFKDEDRDSFISDYDYLFIRDTIHEKNADAVLRGKPSLPSKEPLPKLSGLPMNDRITATKSSFPADYDSTESLLQYKHDWNEHNKEDDGNISSQGSHQWVDSESSAGDSDIVRPVSPAVVDREAELFGGLLSNKNRCLTQDSQWETVGTLGTQSLLLSSSSRRSSRASYAPDSSSPVDSQDNGIVYTENGHPAEFWDPLGPHFTPSHSTKEIYDPSYGNDRPGPFGKSDLVKKPSETWRFNTNPTLQQLSSPSFFTQPSLHSIPPSPNYQYYHHPEILPASHVHPLDSLQGTVKLSPSRKLSDSTSVSFGTFSEPSLPPQIHQSTLSTIPSADSRPSADMNRRSRLRNRRNRETWASQSDDCRLLHSAESQASLADISSFSEITEPEPAIVHGPFAHLPRRRLSAVSHNSRLMKVTSPSDPEDVWHRHTLFGMRRYEEDQDLGPVACPTFDAVGPLDDKIQTTADTVPVGYIMIARQPSKHCRAHSRREFPTIPTLQRRPVYSHVISNRNHAYGRRLVRFWLAIPLVGWLIVGLIGWNHEGTDSLLERATDGKYSRILPEERAYARKHLKRIIAIFVLLLVAGLVVPVVIFHGR